MQEAKPDYILFDLDGTIIDPHKGITLCVEYALAYFGITVGDRATLNSFIGPPLRDSFMEFYGFTPAQAEKAVAKYRERYSSTGVYENTLYPGIREMLEKLKNSGKKIFLATSKPTAYAKLIIRQHDLEPYFSFIGGAELNGSRDRKADVILHVLENSAIDDTSTTAMVGDRRHDIEGARQTGLFPIGVTYGYGSRQELEQAGAGHIVSTVAALAEYICG
ncbi:MAG: HAD-IA family hydrolase [Alistipes sp.]|nr:HAD-IA family hydrolase [Alistipes sp.]